MLTRIISALVALPIALALIHQGGWWFVGLIVVATGICAYEFSAMAGPDDRPTQCLVTLLAVGIIVGVATGWLARPAGLICLPLILLGLILWFLFRPGPIENAGHRLGVTTLGLAWSAGLMSAVLCLRFVPQGLAWLYIACGLAWGSDTGAYFAGKYLGNRKLYPAVSPNKTWAGAVGGVISATAIAFLFREIFNDFDVPTLHLAIIAPVGAALGQMGDLAESLIKRSMGVKDSGKIMPGHGGLLDRVDALVFTAPWLLAYVVIITGIQPQWL